VPKARLNHVGSWTHSDIGERPAQAVTVAIDPNVWSGRALQENFHRVGGVRSCINVSGL
jgi:hypothetical protein